MSFTAEEIGRFDAVLADMYESELTFAILAELALLTVILILALSPRSSWKDTRWGDTSDLYDENEPRYRNGNPKFAPDRGIIERLRDMSASYGTKITIDERGYGVVEL